MTDDFRVRHIEDMSERTGNLPRSSRCSVKHVAEPMPDVVGASLLCLSDARIESRSAKPRSLVAILPSRAMLLSCHLQRNVRKRERTDFFGVSFSFVIKTDII